DAVAATLDDRSLTFGQIDSEANRIANALVGAGIGRGDRVLWWGDTDLDSVPVFAALAKIGAVFAPLNARSSLEEVTPVGAYARPRLLLAGASHAEPAVELARTLAVPFLGDLAGAAGGASPGPPAVAGVDERDPHVIFFTSG